MDANEPLLAAVAFVAAVVVTMVDGRRAVSWAALFAGAGLAPAVASVAGVDGTALLLGAAAAACLAAPLAHAMAHRSSWMAGLDPVVPVVSHDEALFGPRSVRVAAGVTVLPAASWVSFNVPLGSASTVTGVLFPAALVFGCAAMRLLTARTVVDIGAGVAALGLAGAAAWLLAGGAEPFAAAGAAAALAPGAALAAGWLGGRDASARAAAEPAP